MLTIQLYHTNNKDNKNLRSFIRFSLNNEDKYYWINNHNNFQNEVMWNWISIYQKLSEDFIREFKDKVNWYLISINQILSEEFIREFHDKVKWYYISEYQILSEEFKKEFKYKLK